ncbi:transmembrane and coiled-coil domain protein 3 [Salmo salar]|uniref:Transmembrane and coiled-coil domain protein 3 n=1 Tax=Salmo salar TaxID=8030 RepID=A0A1S3KRZ5_SALSA|nr:transmembrane and coiled-coil domain protein 3 [Salmo salar]|eukprot:XP_013981365.1 PREDICTED: transmembrane and coiled-coil domains protein 3-like [Salmo salar]
MMKHRERNTTPTPIPKANRETDSVIMATADSAVRSLSEVEKYLNSRNEMAERSSGEGNSLNIPESMCRGSSENNLDLDLSGIPDSQRYLDSSHRSLDSSYRSLPPGLNSLQQKILRVTEELKIEQEARDDNVAEYLKLVNSADKQQVGRIKQVFEKKNQKSAHSIANMQKKLEQYHKKMKDSSEKDASSKHHSSPKVTSKDRLSLTVSNVSSGSGRHPTDKIKTVGPGVSLSPPFFFSKPRDFANLLRNKFGSADNIAHLKTSLDTPNSFRCEGTGRTLSGSATIGDGKTATPAATTTPKYTSDDECSSGTSLSADSNGNTVALGVGLGLEGGLGAAVTPGQSLDVGDGQGRLDLTMEEVREIRETQGQLEEDMETLRTQFKKDYGFITQTLQEERYRYERLEDQLNDLTELHQAETADLKQELSSIEERVAYQAYERARDIQEALESCQTRVSKLELQQQQQQTVQLESSDARVLLGKSINIMLALVTVILVCVSTAAKFAAPLLRSRRHVMGTFLGMCLLALFWKNWENFQRAMESVLVSA